jgi:tetratricopeptide (TPR) repeat protein
VAHYNLGTLLLHTKLLDEAIREFRAVIMLDPKWVPAYGNLGIALANTDQLDEAIRAFRKYIEVDPKDAWPHLRLGQVLRQQAKFEAALKEYREAIRLQPDDAANHNDLAWMLATCADPQLRDPQQAVALAKRAVQLAPQDGHPWNTLGVALYRAGQFAEAIPALERSLRVGPGQNDAENLFFLAMCHHRRGDAAEARDWRERGATWFQKHKDQLSARQIRDLSEFQAEADAVVGQPPGQAKR